MGESKHVEWCRADSPNRKYANAIDPKKTKGGPPADNHSQLIVIRSCIPRM